MRHLYISPEVRDLEDKIVKIDRNFNFSSFYKEALIGYLAKCNACNTDFLNKKLSEACEELQKTEEKVTYFRKLIQEIKDKEDINDNIKKEKESKKVSIVEKRIIEAIKNIQSFFNLTDEIQIQNLAEDFVINYYSEMGIIDYMELKGFKFREVKTAAKRIEVKQKQNKEIIEGIDGEDYLLKYNEIDTYLNNMKGGETK